MYMFPIGKSTNWTIGYRLSRGPSFIHILSVLRKWRRPVLYEREIIEKTNLSTLKNKIKKFRK